MIRDKGQEFGTTTGRPRRCGWLDLVMLELSHRICGFSSLAIMKLDILSDMDEIKVCVSYKDDKVQKSIIFLHHYLILRSVNQCTKLFQDGLLQE